MIQHDDIEPLELAAQVRSGSVRAQALTEQALSRIEAAQGLNAFTSVDRDQALAAARAIDEKYAAGQKLGALAGLPVAVKDALCTRDQPTTCASKILRSNDGRGWQPPYDATVVARLRAADAVIVGKTNMDEFAMGSSSENSAYGAVRNPWDPNRIPGGSSGGSAVAVAAGLCPLSIGSDTGGSIRQPAALTGCVGLKPSYGRVSRFGLVAFASSLDQIGPFARSVRGAAGLLQAIAGADPQDSTVAATEPEDYLAACGRDVSGLRVGVPAEYFGPGLDPEVQQRVEQALDALSGLGCEVVPVQLPHTEYGVATYYIIATAEASSNLARFDGVRFGLRVESPRADLKTMYGETRDAGFGAEVKRRILLGTYVLSAGYYDAFYLKAQKARTLIRRDFDEAFQKVDIIAAPTSPTVAFKIGERLDDPLSMYLADVYTLPASLAGICGLSLPCGQTAATAERPALPVGLQLLAPAFSESRLFQVASAYETISPARELEPKAKS